jgi:chorismate-pyruvate lyase
MTAPGAWIAVALLASATSGKSTPIDDSYLARLETLALIEQLNGDLLASRSATLSLERWCADHHMAPIPRLVARRDKSVVRAATPEQRGRLQVGPDEPLLHRHVLLACGEHVLSEADNWYVPSRLTPDMNAALESTDTPFGRVILPLKVTRQSISVDRLWSPLSSDWVDKMPWDMSTSAPVQRFLFRHRALLITPAGTPVAEVEENYTREILDFARHGSH